MKIYAIILILLCTIPQISFASGAPSNRGDSESLVSAFKGMSLNQTSHLELKKLAQIAELQAIAERQAGACLVHETVNPEKNIKILHSQAKKTFKAQLKQNNQRHESL